MSNIPNPQTKTINAQDANARWEQSLELTTAFAQIWLANP